VVSQLVQIKRKIGKMLYEACSHLRMWSTQVSKSLNVDLKSCLKSDLDLYQFFKQFERVVNQKLYNDLEYEFECREKLQRLKMKRFPLLQQVCKVYTLVILDMFQK